MNSFEIPKEVACIVNALQNAGFEAYPVGGCVRDVLRGQVPKDWDITTNALPEEIRNVFPKTFYENKFYTVTVQTDSPDAMLREIEVTTYRSEGAYEDRRHPSDIKPAKTLDEDLSRRDFTVNALALRIIEKGAPEIIDPFGGKADLEDKVIRAVGDPEERFAEDALRMLRAARFATTLGFSIEEKTREAIEKHAGLLRAISKERIRDEFMKIIASEAPMTGVQELHVLGLLHHIVPELEEGIDVGQNKHHVYTVWEHNLRALQYGAKEGFSPLVRLAALFHDVGKPRAKRGDGPDSTFYAHDVIGAKMTIQIMERLKFSRADIEKVSKLVRWHLFNYDLEAGTTDSAIRRLIRNVGDDNIEDLVKVRMCDRIGSGVPKAVPYRLRHFQFRVEKVLKEKDAVAVTMLAIDGKDIMEILAIPPGPKIGHLLNALLEEVLDDPAKNTGEYLEKRARDLVKLTEAELIALRKKAEEKIEFLEEEKEETLKKKYFVK